MQSTPLIVGSAFSLKQTVRAYALERLVCRSCAERDLPRFPILTYKLILLDLRWMTWSCLGKCSEATAGGHTVICFPAQKLRQRHDA